MRPAYQPAVAVNIGERLLQDDPWAKDLAAAITGVYDKVANKAEAEQFRARLSRWRGLTL